MEHVEKRKTVWVFQERDAPYPWAMRCTIRKLGRAYRVDGRVYCELVDTGSKSFQFDGVPLSAFPAELSQLLESFGIPVCEGDLEQLKTEKEFFKKQFK